MSLEDIFYLSQSVASVAVIGSLIYLGLQVRSAERSQRAIMQQGRADRTSHGAIAIASPELARVFHKGSAGHADLTREEFTQWMMICRALFLNGEDSFRGGWKRLTKMAGLCGVAAVRGSRRTAKNAARPAPRLALHRACNHFSAMRRSEASAASSVAIAAMGRQAKSSDSALTA